MPTSSYRRIMPGLDPQQLAFPASYRPNDVLIGPWSWCAMGEDITGLVGNNFGSASYPAASRVLAYQFAIADYYLVQKVWWMNGITVGTDSCDVGVYNEAGTSLILHGGSTLIAGASSIQEADCADTLLTPGRYWCAYVQGGVTATPNMCSPGAILTSAMGMAQMAGSGSTLGATFTPARMASGVIMCCGIAARTQVA